jgi:hypothetical protein
MVYPETMPTPSSMPSNVKANDLLLFVILGAALNGQGDSWNGSKEWTRKWLEVLPLLGHEFGDDGQFLMECSLPKAT